MIDPIYLFITQEYAVSLFEEVSGYKYRNRFRKFSLIVTTILYKNRLALCQDSGIATSAITTHYSQNDAKKENSAISSEKQGM